MSAEERGDPGHGRRRPGTSRRAGRGGEQVVFERFTDASRRVLGRAQEEARLLANDHVGTQHLLLGLLEVGGPAGRALDACGASLEALRAQLHATRSDRIGAPEGTMPLTARAKRVLELSLEETLRLGHHDVGPEHLLLGIVQEGAGVGAQALVDLGVAPEVLRRQVLALAAGGAPGPSRASSSHPSRGLHEAAHAPGDPTCGRCGATLGRSARYRVLRVPPADGEPAAEPLALPVVFCARCGCVLAFGGGRLAMPGEDVAAP